MPFGGSSLEEGACCSTWLHDLRPRDRTEGTRNERHTCPTCKRTYVVTFRCALVEGQLASKAVDKWLAATLRMPGRVPV
jgi:hypothetical protein